MLSNNKSMSEIDSNKYIFPVILYSLPFHQWGRAIIHYNVSIWCLGYHSNICRSRRLCLYVFYFILAFGAQYKQMMKIFFLVFLLFLISGDTLSNQIDFDSNGYIVYCPCMGKCQFLINILAPKIYQFNHFVYCVVSIF